MLDTQSAAQCIVRERLGLTAYIFSVAKSYHLAEDVFQEIFVRATKRAENFESEKHLINWFRVAGRNRAIDLIRSTEGRYTGLSEQALAMVEEDWDEIMETEPVDAIDLLANCLEKLSDSNSEIIRLRYFENCDCQTIADRMNRKIKTIYQSIFRIQKSLKSCVNQGLEAQA